MKIHTDLTEKELRRAFTLSGVPVADMRVTVHGSRSRSRRFDVTFDADRMKGRKVGQNGLTGLGFDEWGLFIEQVYRMDEAAIVGPYRDREDFREATGLRFDYLTWENRHPVHRWGRVYGNDCCECGAERLSLIHI